MTSADQDLLPAMAAPAPADALACGQAFDGWFMYHSAGVYPGQQRDIAAALTTFTAHWCAPDDRRWDIALKARDGLLQNWARLIGTTRDRLFAAPNVTEAFARCIDGLGDRVLRGRVVLVAADCFPSLHFLLNGLAARHGFVLRTVPLAPGQRHVADADFIAAWESDVALALITWVSSHTSKRADLDRLMTHARARDSFVAIDITQGAGIVPFDLNEHAVDFVCGSTLKWLCGMPGAGFGYAGPRLQDVAVPAMRGWFSQEDPWNWDLEAFSFARDARRFDTGTPSVLPFVASKPGFDWVLSQAPGALRARNLRLSESVIHVIDELGLRLLSPRDAGSRGGSVMADIPGHVDIARLTGALARDGVWADSRGRTLRLSPGACTHQAGIDRLAAGILRALVDPSPTGTA